MSSYNCDDYPEDYDDHYDDHYDDGEDYDKEDASFSKPEIDHELEQKHSNFTYAAGYGHVDWLKSMLSDPTINPAHNNNTPICHATLMGHLEIVKLLLTDPGVVSDLDESLFYKAPDGHFEIVETLRLALSWKRRREAIMAWSSRQSEED